MLKFQSLSACQTWSSFIYIAMTFIWILLQGSLFSIPMCFDWNFLPSKLLTITKKKITHDIRKLGWPKKNCCFDLSNIFFPDVLWSNVDILYWTMSAHVLCLGSVIVVFYIFFPPRRTCSAINRSLFAHSSPRNSAQSLSFWGILRELCNPNFVRYFE